MNLVKFCFVLTSICCSAACCYANAKITNSCIATSNSPSALEKRAAAELASYLEKTVGKKISVVTENAVTDSDSVIYVGFTKYAEKNNIDFNKFSREEWLIRSIDNDLILGGGYNSGILYSVYDYLERHAKIRVYDEHTVKIVKNPDLTLGKWNLRRKPSFDARMIYDCLDWSIHSKFMKEFNKGFTYTGTDTGMHKFIGGYRPFHTAHDYMKSWPKDKKHLYALQSDGSRPIPKNPIGPGQMCLTHPEVRALVLAQLRKFIEADRKAAKAGNYPHPIFYDIRHNDNYHKCVCSNCMAIADREGSYSGTLIDFINHIASEIGKDYPDIIIRTFAYTYTAAPPKNIKTAPNVSMHLAFLGAEMGGEYYYYDSLRDLKHPFNKHIANRIAKWSNYSNYICRWEYWRLFPSVPEANLRIGSIPHDVKYNHKCNVRYIFAEYENPHWNSFFALSRYLGYKLFDDISKDPEALKKEFMQDYYGAAAPAMTELLNFMQQSQDQAGHRIGDVAPGKRKYMNDAYFKKVFSLMEKAEKAVADDPERLLHVQMEKAPLIGSLLQSRPYIKNFSKDYDFAKLSEQLREYSEKYIEYFYGSDKKRKDAENSLTGFMKSINAYDFQAVIPAELKAKSEKAAFFSAYQFSKGTKAKMVDDSAAFRGKAIKYPFPAANELVFTINDWMEPGEANIPVSKKQLPPDGKYRWISLNKFPFINNGRHQMYIKSAKEICVGFYRSVAEDTTAEIFIHAKRTASDIYIDQVILIPRTQKNFNIPPQFKNKTVYVMPWGVFKRAHGAAIITDPAGAWNGAIAITGEGVTRNKATEFGVYSPHSKKVIASTRILSDNIRNEKYNLIKIGKFKAANGVFFYAGSNWALQCPLRWISGDGTLYASVKFTGRSYVRRSKQKDMMMIDYIIFVKD